MTLIASEMSPVYEAPVIVKQGGLVGNHKKVALNTKGLKAAQESQQAAAAKQKLRNDITRDFQVEDLEKYVGLISKGSFSKLSNTAKINNLNEIRTLSVLTQQNIFKTCGKISELLKLLHLKLAEIKAINEKMNAFKDGSFKKSLTGVRLQSLKLRTALVKEKVIITKVMKQIEKKQAKLVKALSKYDKKFASQNEAQLKGLLNEINSQLKPHMKLPYFKKAYSLFIAHVLTITKDLKPEHFKDAKNTAAALIKKFFEEYLKKAKAEWEKQQKKDMKKGSLRRELAKLSKKIF